jgi:hypothetical protein
MSLTPEERRDCARRAAQSALQDCAVMLIVDDALERARQPLGQGPLLPDLPEGRERCLDCDGNGRYPTGAICKSCAGAGHVPRGSNIGLAALQCLTEIHDGGFFDNELTPITGPGIPLYERMRALVRRYKAREALKGK